MSQLRKYLRWKRVHSVRILFQKARGLNIGISVFMEKNVQLMRYPKNITIGNEVVIKEGVKICACNEMATISIGERTTVGYNTFIFASKKIIIGSDCLIAPFVYIVDSDHEAKRGLRINQQPNISEEIIIGNDVWIASNVTILKGVKVADGCIIAAHSLLNTDTEPYGIYAGTPARKIGERHD